MQKKSEINFGENKGRFCIKFPFFCIKFPTYLKQVEFPKINGNFYEEKWREIHVTSFKRTTNNVESFSHLAHSIWNSFPSIEQLLKFIDIFHTLYTTHKHYETEKKKHITIIIIISWEQLNIAQCLSRVIFKWTIKADTYSLCIRIKRLLDEGILKSR